MYIFKNKHKKLYNMFYMIRTVNLYYIYDLSFSHGEIALFRILLKVLVLSVLSFFHGNLFYLFIDAHQLQT